MKKIEILTYFLLLAWTVCCLQIAIHLGPESLLDELAWTIVKKPSDFF
jgi:hypothetical protein